MRPAAAAGRATLVSGARDLRVLAGASQLRIVTIEAFVEGFADA